MAIRRGAPLGLPGVRLLLVALLLGAAATASAQPAEERGGDYRRALVSDPVTLDAARIGDIYSRSVAQQLFDGLVQFDQTLTVVPALAQYWKASRDNRTWTFTLRKGVKFHHGREVTSDDVVYSFTRLLDPAVKSGAADLFMGIEGADEFRAGKAKRVAGLTAPDRYTVVVHVKEATVPFVSTAAVGHAKIVPREVVEQAGDAFGTQPVGTGPFKFVRWERGREIVLAANPDYFDGPPKVARVVYRIFPGEKFDTIYDEFKRGALEDAPLPTKITAADYRRIKTDPTHVYVRRPILSVRFYGFNVRQKPLDDRRIRQAVLHAVDRETINEELYLGRVITARAILPPGSLGYNPNLAGYAYDPARARELLAEAGHPNGAGLGPIVFWSTVKDERIVREHEQIRKNLEAVGLRGEFQYLTDWPTFSKRLAERKFPAFLYAWFADVPDPDNFLATIFHSASPRNFMGYANRTVDDLLTQARHTGDAQRRVDLYRRAEQAIIDDAPMLPVWHYTYERLFQPYVKNVEVSSFGDPYIPLRKIWLERRR